MHGRLRQQLAKLFAIKDTPDSIALGSALGVFLGFTPLFGLKTLLALGLAWAFRANKIAAVVGVCLHDLLLPFWPALYLLKFNIGLWPRHEPHHVPACLELLKTWHAQAEASPTAAHDATVQLKRAKEETATRAALMHASQLGLTSMVLYAGEQFAGFTLGEMLDAETCGILIERTDRRFKGTAQYIFSEFCRQYWAHTQWCNVGDDWEIPSLAWTKESYRPAARREKWILHLPAASARPHTFTGVSTPTRNELVLAH